MLVWTSTKRRSRLRTGRNQCSGARSANWYIVFRFESGDVKDVDLTDYH